VQFVDDQQPHPGPAQQSQHDLLQGVDSIRRSHWRPMAVKIVL
jgi:hypothetical protein